VTAAVVTFVWNARPEILAAAGGAAPTGQSSFRGVLIALSAAAILTGGALSWFASANPDGLEWAMFKTSGREELEPPEKGMHESLSRIQERTAFLPDYSFRKPAHEEPEETTGETAAPWPSVDAGTSVAGLVGGGLTLFAAALIGMALKRRTG